MIAFEVWHDGKLVTVAGRDDLKLLLAIVKWVEGEGDVEVNGQGGLDVLTWPKFPIKVGSEVLIRVVETGDVSEPEKRMVMETDGSDGEA